jgi:sigma-B regulation protein RsbU (phosphoserine phosphatase)
MGSNWLRRELSVVQTRQARKQNEATAIYMASLVESCDEAIIGTTLDGRILSWNTAAERLFGYSAAEIIGRSYSLLVPPYRPEDLAEILTRIRDGGHVEPCETVRLRKNGTKVEVLLTVSPVKTSQGRIIGASILTHDITQRKLDENERTALIQELTAALVHSVRVRVENPGGSKSSPTSPRPNDPGRR